MRFFIIAVIVSKLGYAGQAAAYKIGIESWYRQILLRDLSQWGTPEQFSCLLRLEAWQVPCKMWSLESAERKYYLG